MNSMNPLLRKVAEFHKAFNIENQMFPTVPDQATIELRYKLALEELDEFKEAAEAGNLVGMLDALVDQLYILLGTVHTCGMGIALEDGFYEVHRSNMTKLDADGKPVYREDGKVIKSDRYDPPNLELVIKETYLL